MDIHRARASLDAARLCLERRSLDSAVSRAYFAIFQMAVCALEKRGVKRTEWTHKGVHSEFVQTFVRRRKIVPANFAGALPALMDLRHMADYRQPGISQRQAERAIRVAEEFLRTVETEVVNA
jgi:uncharacterized protein (UPF0332 family)